jgi:hypothetical protein
MIQKTASKKPEERPIVGEKIGEQQVKNPKT